MRCCGLTQRYQSKIYKAGSANAPVEGLRFLRLLGAPTDSSNDVSKEMKSSITQIIKFRDMAVHPSLELKNAVLRPDISVGVDWRFSAFRFENARNCLDSTLKIFIFLYEYPRSIKANDGAMKNIFLALQELGVVRLNH